MASHGLGEDRLCLAEDLRAGWRQRRVHGAPVVCVTVRGPPAPFLEPVDGLGHCALADAEQGGNLDHPQPRARAIATWQRTRFSHRGRGGRCDRGYARPVTAR